jgi:Spy/CpxP family protein refolding chaperone
MFRTSRVFAAAALAAGLAAAGYASAQNTSPDSPPFRQGGRGGPGGPFMGRGGPLGPGGPIGLPLRQLELSESQQEQVRAIAQSHEQELKAAGDRARQARQAVHTAITAETFDENLIRARAAEASQIEADVAVLQARLRAEVVQQVLTSEQRERLKKFEAEAQQRMQNAPERGPRGRGGRG